MNGRDETAAALEALCASVGLPDARVRASAERALDAKTKPRRSLGRIESLAADIAAIRGSTDLGDFRPVVVVAAGDHGVAIEGVSAYPQVVTQQMVANIAGGGAAISVLAREFGARLVVVDAGTLAPVVHPGAVDARVRAGTGNIAVEPAMRHGEAIALVLHGAALARELAAEGCNLIALGEMGIANTTVASALASAYLHLDPDVVTGTGTGIDSDARRRKVEVIRRALAIANPADAEPVATLAMLGGCEIAYLAGVAVGAAAARIPVLLDGFISTAAALVATRLAPSVGDSLIASHCSQEPGHVVVLEALGLRALVDLELRLGEGSGAALCIPLVRAALALLADMATFSAVGVTDTGA